jgi:hypothetical protein
MVAAALGGLMMSSRVLGVCGDVGTLDYHLASQCQLLNSGDI